MGFFCYLPRLLSSQNLPKQMQFQNFNDCHWIFQEYNFYVLNNHAWSIPNYPALIHTHTSQHKTVCLSAFNSKFIFALTFLTIRLDLEVKKIKFPHLSPLVWNSYWSTFHNWKVESYIRHYNFFKADIINIMPSKWYTKK